MAMIKGILTFMAALLAAWCATKVVIPLVRKRGLLDVPNGRSSHTHPTPVGGGLGIIVGILAGLIVAAFFGFNLPGVEFLFGAAVIALIGFLDDRGGGLSVWFRFLVQLAVAGLIVWRCGAIEQLPLPAPLNIELGLLALPISLFWIVGFVNLYNFLDGIDGFAGLQGVIAGLAIGLWGHNELTGVGLAIAGACAGFLPHNWRPARIFMGDIGSGTLGFLIAALPFQVAPASRGDALFIVAMGLWFFASDGVFTLFRRLARGERIWVAHRTHLYQRLVRTGLRHDYVAVCVMVTAAALSALAVVAVRWQADGFKWSVVGLACAGFLAYYLWTLLREKQFGEGISAQVS